MTGEQISINFDPRSAARRSDPATSHQAAINAQRFAASHAGRVLEALRRLGPAGKTRVAHACGLSDVEVCRRFDTLRKAGLAFRTSFTEPSGAGVQEAMWVAERR